MLADVVHTVSHERSYETASERAELVNQVLANLNNDWMAQKRQAFLENLAAYIKGHHCPVRVEGNAVVFTRNGVVQRASTYQQARRGLGLEG